MEKITDESYMILIEKVSVKTAKDLRNSVRRLRKNPEDYEAFLRKRECENFFRSGWFTLAYDLDPDLLIERILEDA